MDYASAMSLAQTGMLFVPADSPMANDKPDMQLLHREMSDALGQSQASVPCPTLVIAPSDTFDQVWQAIANGIFSENLKKNFICLHGDGEIQFVPK